MNLVCGGVIGVSASMAFAFKDRIRRLVEDLGYICVEVKLVRDLGGQVVRVTIDSPDAPIGHGDCEAVSRKVGELLDGEGEGFLKGRYYLEVSSPGPNRPLLSLDDFRRFKGSKIRVSTGKGKKRTYFIDDVFDDGMVRLVHEGEELVCPWGDLKNPRLCG